MRLTKIIPTLTLGVGLGLAIGGFALAGERPAPSPEMDAWMKAAKLGPYDTGKHDWAEIEKKAKEEGAVVIYSASSRMAKVAKRFMDKYPGIKATSYDLGSVKTIEKTVREQSANLFNADIITTGGSGQVVHELWGKNRIVNFVPDMFKDKIPLAYREPVLIRVLEAVVFMYNGEAYPDAPPVKNIWEFTEPRWKGKLVMKDPLQSLTNYMGVATLVQHADEMAAAYHRYTGKNIVLHEGVPDAGYELLYRLLHNDLVILKSGSKSAKASGKPGQKNPPAFFGAMTYYRYNFSKGLVNRFFIKLDPAAKIIYPTYTAIAARAPHPNAAKLFTAFLLGSAELKADMKLKKPYKKGRSAELLQGLLPYFEPGSKSPRNDVPFPEGGEAWDDMKAWTVDPDFMYREGPKVRDFWIQESAG
ncbi:MAG TPA: ABC transporter substrate-binding protein [Rhizobiales bacterium]|nr:ABC transporter substrate-binding protein [Hyphomicrobiales bacterium]